MKNVSSIKDRLKNYAKQSGRTVQGIFTIYILERVLYRMSISKYVNNFTLKGGILLYGLYTDDFTRATTDIDLLGGNISNDKNALKTVFKEILSMPANDPISFDLANLEVVNITEFKKYHGVNVSTTAYLDRTRIPVNLDIGFGDIIYPERVKMDYPTLLDDESPILYTYSIYSTIAEKLEAIVSLGITNSRYKDFYDLCTIPERESLDGKLLKEAIVETFKTRKTDFDIIAAFEEDFTDDHSRQQRWRGFLKTKNVSYERSFKNTVNDVKNFLMPIIEAIKFEKPFDFHWIPGSKTWESNISMKIESPKGDPS